MKFTVTFRVEGRYRIDVDADYIDDARKIANAIFYSGDIDMNDMEVVDSYDIIVDDDKGNILWDRE